MISGEREREREREKEREKERKKEREQLLKSGEQRFSLPGPNHERFKMIQVPS